MTEIQSRGSQVFDLKSLREAQREKKPEGPVCTYTTFDSECEIADADHPFLILRMPAKTVLRHHVNGSFMNPSRRTGFEFKTEAGPEYTDVWKIDRRFEPLLKWMGENQLQVRLSGCPFKDGFGIYKIHAVNYSGKIAASTDGFLQMTIGRILSGRFQEETESEEETEVRMREGTRRERSP